MKQILVIGDSHTATFERGRQQLKAQGALSAEVGIFVKPLGGGHILPTPFFRDAGSHAEITHPDYQKNFLKLPPAAMTVDAIALSMPLWPMRVIHKMVWPGWALAQSWGQGAPRPGPADASDSPVSETDFVTKPISRGVFRQMVLADQRYVLELAALLARIGLPVVALSPPGLFRDHATLRRMAPEAVRAMFACYRDIMKAELAARAIPVVDLPGSCLDAAGFMKPEYRHEDPKDEHHANGAFGALMIRRLQDWGRQSLVQSAA